MEEFENFLNSLIPGIKVKFTARDRIIEFLDTQVYKYTDNHKICKLKTKVFFKSTDTHQLLHRNSFHPPHTFTGIVKSQLIRFKRISSSIHDYNQAALTLIKVLTQRGYKRKHLILMKRQIWHSYDCTIKRDKPKDETQILPVVTHYDRFQVRLNKVVTRYSR